MNFNVYYLFLKKKCQTKMLRWVLKNINGRFSIVVQRENNQHSIDPNSNNRLLQLKLRRDAFNLLLIQLLSR